jgi:hypothetical protein
LKYFLIPKRSGPTTYFWYRETLQISPDIESTPGFNLKLAAALLASWILVYLCMIKGIKSSGKVNLSPLLLVINTQNNSQQIKKQYKKYKIYII